ncbi:MAG: hypothetical protein SGARI_004642 [Bacillariaceae sp.]
MNAPELMRQELIPSQAAAEGTEEEDEVVGGVVVGKVEGFSPHRTTPHPSGETTSHSLCTTPPRQRDAGSDLSPASAAMMASPQQHAHLENHGIEGLSQVGMSQHDDLRDSLSSVGGSGVTDNPGAANPPTAAAANIRPIHNPVAATPDGPVPAQCLDCREGLHEGLDPLLHNNRIMCVGKLGTRCQVEYD